MRYAIGLLLVPSVLLTGTALASTPFLRGDANHDERLDIADPVWILIHVFSEFHAAPPLDALDVDDDGTIGAADALHLVSYLFSAHPRPQPPFPDRGFDPTPMDPFTDGDEYDPTLPLPDLAPKSLFFDADGRLNITIANEGQADVPVGRGRLAVFVDGRRIRDYPLSDLPDPSLHTPGGLVTIRTDLVAAGSNRRVAALVDPDDEIRESNEFQNTLSRTLTPPLRNGSDLAVRDLALGSSGELLIVVRNSGTSDSPENLEAHVTVAVEQVTVAEFLSTLPALRAGGGETTIHPIPAIMVDSNRRVRVDLEILADSQEIDTTNHFREEILPDGPALDAYLELLSSEKVKNGIIWEGPLGIRSYDQWDISWKDELDQTLVSLESGDPLPLSSPPVLLPGQSISASDAWQIYLAHVAQSLWVEAHGIVPWHLAELPEELLAYLLDGRLLVSFNGAANTYRFSFSLMGSVTAWNPRIAYEFLSNLGMIQPSQVGTIHAVTDWMRAHLIHTSGADDFTQLYDYAGLPPVDKVLYPLEGRRHKTAGCWGTTGLYAALLRSVNIPVQSERILLGSYSHSRPEFSSVSRSMPHGDDPYNIFLTPSGAPIPSSTLLYSLEDMAARFLNPEVDCVADNCNTPGDQALFNKGKDQLQLAFGYLGDRLLYEYSYYGEEYLNDSLRGPRIGGAVQEFVRPYFSDTERAAMIAAVERRLEEIGGGDLENGKRLVRERYSRFGSNK